MFLEYKTTYPERPKGKTGPKSKKVTLLKCDQCSTLIEKQGHRKRYKPGLHFCSQSCSNLSQEKGGKKYNNVTKTNLEKYGTENVFQNKDIKDKIKKTFQKKYGVNHQMDLPSTRKKIKETCLKKYGVEYSLQSEEIKKKGKITLLEKYGVSNACELRDHVDWQKAWQKQHQTKKELGVYGKSKIEDKFYEYLCFKYEKSNIERQILVNNWSIDFHIKSKDIYIQFDGVYYHGLDRPLEEIKKFTNKRDVAIYKIYCRDLEQNKWFKNNNMKLIRVREDNFKIGERLDV